MEELIRQDNNGAEKNNEPRRYYIKLNAQMIPA